MSEYDQRQYNMMLWLLDSLSSSIPSRALSKTLGDLEALSRLLEERDENWQSSFYEEWGSLEEVFELAHSLGREALSEDEKSLVLASINGLKELINQKMQKAA